MKHKKKNEKLITRRGVLPILGGSLLIPFLGFGNTDIDQTPIETEEEYQILLKPDGSTVKVKASALKNSKVVNKKVSNKLFLNWLGKKL